MKRLSLLLTLLLCVTVQVHAQDDYPAWCHTKVDLNVRSGADISYSRIGLLQKGDTVKVLYLDGPESKPWGAIDYDSKRGYVSMKYMQYDYAVPQTRLEDVKQNGKFVNFLSGVWKFVKKILIIVVIILVIGLFQYIVEFAVYAGMFAGGGALLFCVFGGNGSTGAVVGLIVAAAIGVGMLLNGLDVSLSDFRLGGIIRVVSMGAYYIFSFPIYLLNRIEHSLVSPWRYFFRNNWPSDTSKPVWRVVTEIITVAMYVATTPLRFTNAVIYNIFVHCITGIYDLFLEVMAPSDDDEGGKGVLAWIYMLPWRVIKYACWHVFLLLIESAVWTVVDIFIPARTFYHGTNLNAGTAITSDPRRNKYMQNTSRWSSGTFLASSDPNCSWAGRGVYFAIQRRLALAYSGSNRSGIGGDAVMIACRVSMGRVISYTLMPDSVYRQAGGGGKHDEINKFADAHNYTAGEWYNYNRVWEYCLFDWQNRYNHPWRIRPIYMLNLRTGRAQHIIGGMQHWLFDKDVWDDIFG